MVPDHHAHKAAADATVVVPVVWKIKEVVKDMLVNITVYFKHQMCQCCVKLVRNITHFSQENDI